jgi:hypothetical protein
MLDSQFEFFAPSGGNEDRYGRDVEQVFDAEVDGCLVTFIPSSPYHAKLRRDDAEVLWLTYVNPSRCLDEKFLLCRHATKGSIIDGYRAARHIVAPVSAPTSAHQGNQLRRGLDARPSSARLREATHGAWSRSSCST